MEAFSGPAVAARLHECGLLDEDQRQVVLGRVAELALETPDSGWLTGPEYKVLTTERERARLLERIRVELVSSLDHELDNWRLNEQSDDIEAYYQPLEEALDDYASALAHDETAVALLRSAKEKVDERVRHVLDPTLPNIGSIIDAASKVSGSGPSSRSVFDDVDV
jgi:hypothetical protein